MVGQGNRGAGGWWAAAEIAARQHGVVSRGQLREVGLTEAEIDHALAIGRLHPVFRGTFGLGHAGIGTRGKMLAAALACGPGSVVSHGTAAYLLGIWERQPALIDVIAPVEAGRRITGVRRRHTPPPLARDRWSHEAVPCTGPSRTIVDVAGIVGERALRRTVEQAAVHALLNVPEIDAILDGPRRRGSRQLRSVLESWRRYSPALRLRSVMEAKLLPMLSSHGIPAPECNVMLWIRGEAFEVDFLWRRRRLVVEADSRKYHDNPEAERRDRRRDEVLPGAGYRIWRLRWDDLERKPDETMATLTRLLRSAVR